MRSGKNQDLFKDGQLAKAIYLRNMSAMKDVLNLGELKFGDRKSEAYRYFKKVVMDAFYMSMTDLFEALESEGLSVRCDCGTSVRQGYKSCDKCSGAGFSNSEEFFNWFNSSSERDSSDEEME